jgi:hypothetical protein
MKRWLYLTHRWLGVALCLLMAPWFLSGMVMIYVGYPKLTDQERWAGLPALPTEGCCVGLAEALRASGLADNARPRAGGSIWRLTSVAGVPTYVFADGVRGVAAVNAVTGQRVTQVDSEQALAAARHFAGGAAARYRELVAEDAWTHSKALDAHRPLHVVQIDDDAQRWLYVSGRTGEVVRDATRVERTWGWIGAWLHWLYLFRGGAVDSWWHEIVVVTSVLGSVLAVTGVVVGVWRWRFRGTYKAGRHTPYAEFNARWHHLLGMVGGVLALTWVFSGLLSVNPWKVFDAPGPKADRVAYAGGPFVAREAPDATKVLKLLASGGTSVKELNWQRVGGVYQVLALGNGSPQVVDSSGLLPEGLPDARWRDAAASLLPNARIVAQERLTAYDAYYVSREPHTMTGGRDQPLPVWRLRFDDESGTTVTIDPHTGSILQVQDSHRRASRWLFAFLHSFDLPVLLNSRPAWDVGMLGFSLFGLGLSLTGVVTGWRRVRTKMRRSHRHATTSEIED